MTVMCASASLSAGRAAEGPTVGSTVGGSSSPDAQAVDTHLSDGGEAIKAEAIRSALQSNPRGTVERLNKQWLATLISAWRFDEAEEFANAGSVAVARDTWQVEQLQRHRVEALRLAGRHEEALAAAKGLFLVAGLGSVPHDLELIAGCLRAARPDDPGAAARFKMQQLAGAQEVAGEREKALTRHGKPVLAGVRVDPRPFEQAIEQRKGRGDFDGLYGMGNLLLLSGRVAEARAAFEKAYAVAPPGELRYATEGLAKVIKAEDESVGRANAFVQSIRPKR